MCRAVASSKQALENEICHGSIRDKQLAGEHSKAAKLFTEADGHRRVVGGAVEWCHMCGCFAENRSKGLSMICTGIPRRDDGYGGMWGQRRKLLQGTHPKTGAPLPFTRNIDGTLWDRGCMKEELQGGTATTEGHARDDGFYTYVPEKFAKADDGRAVSSRASFSEIRERIKRKEASRNERKADDT